MAPRLVGAESATQRGRLDCATARAEPVSGELGRPPACPQPRSNRGVAAICLELNPKMFPRQPVHPSCGDRGKLRIQWS